MGETDYYGRLVEVIKLEYPTWPVKKTVLFKCEWFDITENVGIKIHRQYKLVDINHTRRYASDESFVLAMQASQVYYVEYPSLRRHNRAWWAVCKIQARGVIELPNESRASTVEPFQEQEIETEPFAVISESESIQLQDPSAELIDICDDDLQSDNEEELLSETEAENDDDDGDIDLYVKFQSITLHVELQ